MKILLKVILGLFATIGLVATAVFGLARLDQLSSSFSSYGQLKASGLMERGWIPDGLPISLRRIEESHDVSNNTGWASFEYDPADTATTRQTCKLLAEMPGGAKFLCPPFDGQSFVVVLAKNGEGLWHLIPDSP